jgi:hypothetical protein
LDAVTGTSGAGLVLSSAPGISGFASPSKIAPHSALSGPPADPFAGTPADPWGDGVAGIVLPAARPAGSYTAAQVAFAYKTTRKLMAAADLNKRTLLGGRPTALADLLPGSERTWFLANLDKKGVDKKGAELSTRHHVVRTVAIQLERRRGGHPVRYHGRLQAPRLPGRIRRRGAAIRFPERHANRSLRAGKCGQ